MIERRIYKKIKDHLKERQVTVITGIRRCGKTTLMKMLFNSIKSKNKLYLDLEAISNRIFFDENKYENILLKLQNIYGLTTDSKIYLALDEIQYVKNIPGIVKYLYDHYNIKFILTGSSSYYLKNLFTESLAGRKKIFELYTLDFYEYLKFKNVFTGNQPFLQKKFFIDSYINLNEFYNDFIKFGGFPEVVLNRNINAKVDLLKDILDSYLRVDIKNLSDFDNYSNLYKILKSLASRAGNKLDILTISRTTGISRATVSNFIELFEGTYLIYRIPVYSINPAREIIKTPKLFFQDNGLLNTLAEIGSGVQFENSVFNQLKHHGKLNYYSLKTGREIDFILDNKIAMEVKEHAGDFDIKRLNRLSSNISIKNNYMIFRYAPPNDFSSGTNFIWGGDIL